MDEFWDELETSVTSGRMSPARSLFTQALDNLDLIPTLNLKSNSSIYAIVKFHKEHSKGMIEEELIRMRLKDG